MFKILYYIVCLLVCVVVLPFQFIVVPILLLTKWDGTTTWFGNMLYGRGNTHVPDMTVGFWQEFLWLTYKNPINNLLNAFGVVCTGAEVTDNTDIGDHIAGGHYFAKMGKAWEFYLIAPYVVGDNDHRCLRIRLGWKIVGKPIGALCPLVFTINPVMRYSGQ